MRLLNQGGLKKVSVAKARHSHKRSKKWLKLLSAICLALIFTFGSHIISNVQAAHVTFLEKPILFSQSPSLPVFSWQQLLEETYPTAFPATEETTPPEVHPPIYTHAYDSVGSQTVYLTIDDGPSKNTARILDILAQYQAKATFFMLEPAMSTYSAELVRMQEEGHALGMHGVTHNKNVVYASADSVVNEMLTGQARIAELTGVTTPLFRAPYGSKPHMTAEYRQAVSEAGLSMWDWNVDSLDWKYRNKNYVQHTINQLEKLKSQGRTPVILIHDTQKTADSLPLLLEYLVNHGYQFALINGETEPMQFAP